MKSIITKISEVDSAGSVSVIFDIFDDKGSLIFPNMQTQGNPESIVENITRISTELKNKTQAVRLLSIGQEIII